MKAYGVKFIQSFHEERRLKNANFSLISLTCLPWLHKIENFSLLFCGDFSEGSEKPN